VADVSDSSSHSEVSPPDVSLPRDADGEIFGGLDAVDDEDDSSVFEDDGEGAFPLPITINIIKDNQQRLPNVHSNLFVRYAP